MITIEGVKILEKKFTLGEDITDDELRDLKDYIALKPAWSNNAKFKKRAISLLNSIEAFG